MYQRMPELLNGTAALVTGASSWIGAATARVLASQGVSVALAARRRERLNGLASEIQRGGGGRALVIETDMTRPCEVFGAVVRAVAEFRRLDIVVNNTGVMLLGPAERAPIEEWAQMVVLDVKGMLYVAHAALPHLSKAAEVSAWRIRSCQHQFGGGPHSPWRRRCL